LAECRGGCNPVGYECGECVYDLKGFAPVCISHVCELRGAQPGHLPKLTCPPDPPYEPLFPGAPDPE
jgi:hypothetical protein